MKFRVLTSLLTVALPLALLAAEEKPAVTPKPTILKRWMKALGWSTGAAKGATVYKGLELNVKVQPEIKVAESKDVRVTVSLTNRTNKINQLDFPTSQRIEVLVKTSDGKTIEQWSEDQAFTNEPTMVTINPDERLEYVVKVATRDMVVGQSYTIEAFFPHFEQLRKSVVVKAVSETAAGTPAPGSSPAPATPVIKAKKSKPAKN
jgi:hypothetical protein